MFRIVAAAAALAVSLGCPGGTGTASSPARGASAGLHGGVGTAGRTGSSAGLPLASTFHMVTGQLGWASSSRSLYRTVDGGGTWRNVSLRLPSGANPVCTDILDARSVWLGSVGPHGPLLLGTANAGRTWQSFHVPTRGYAEFACPYFVDGLHGWFTTSFAGMEDYGLQIYRTTDGGHRWSYLPRRQIGCKSILAFQSTTAGYCTTGHGGGSVPASRPIYITEDGGRSWLLPHLPVPALYRMTRPHGVESAFSDAQVPIILSTRDAVMPVAFYTNLPSNDRDVVIAYKTTDAGVSWTAATPLPIKADAPTEMSWVSLRAGWADVGCALYRTQDGGLHWQQLATNPSQGVRNPDFVSASAGFALPCRFPSGGAILLHTADGGLTWHVIRPTLIRR